MNNRIFLSLYIILFTGSFSAGMVIPLLAGYAHQAGADSFEIGLIFGITSASMIICNPLVGYRSDERGRKRFIAMGLAMGALTSIGLAFSDSVAKLFLFRFLQGVGGAMVGPVSLAYAGELVKEGEEGHLMGRLNTALWLGFGSGPVIGGLLKDGWGIEAAFYGRGGLCLVSLLICVLVLPADAAARQAAAKRLGCVFRPLVANRGLQLIFAFRVTLYMCIGVFWAFSPLIGEVNFDMSGMATGLVITIGTFSGTVFLPLSGKIADLVDKRILITLGGLLLTMAMLKLALVGAPWELYLASVLIGIGAAMIIPAILVITVKIGAQHSSMGTVVSLMAMGDNMGMILGPMLCGALMGRSGSGFALQIIAMLMALMTGFTFMSIKRPEYR